MNGKIISFIKHYHIIKILTKAIKLSKNMFMNPQKLTGFLAITRTARTYVKILYEFYVVNYSAAVAYAGFFNRRGFSDVTS